MSITLDDFNNLIEDLDEFDDVTSSENTASNGTKEKSKINNDVVDDVADEVVDDVVNDMVNEIDDVINNDKNKDIQAFNYPIDTLSNIQPIDKILGFLYGSAFGDAICFGFKDRIFGDRKKIEYPNYEVSGFALGDWSGITDTMIVSLMTFIECSRGLKIIQSAYDQEQLRKLIAIPENVIYNYTMNVFMESFIPSDVRRILMEFIVHQLIKLKNDNPGKNPFSYPLFKEVIESNWESHSFNLLQVIEAIKNYAANKYVTTGLIVPVKNKEGKIVRRILFDPKPNRKPIVNVNQENRLEEPYFPLDKLQIEFLLAARLKYWVNYGFNELQESSSAGCPTWLKEVVYVNGYLFDPIYCSKAKSIINGNRGANTSAIGLACFMSVMSDINDVVLYAERVAKMITYDSRSVVVCVTLSYILHYLQHYEIANNPKQLLELIERGCTFGSKYFTDEHYELYFNEYQDYIRAGMSGDLASIKLSQKYKTNYSFKLIGVALYTIRRISQLIAELANENEIDYKIIFEEIANEGGDTNTNGFVAGAIIGSICGYKRLPKDLNNMPDKKFLDKYARELMLELK